MNDPIPRFWELCTEAEVAYGRKDSPGTPDIERFALMILDLIQHNPLRRQEFTQCFIALIDDPKRGPFEIVAFCMHTLRWTEVRNATQNRLEKSMTRNDWRAIPILRGILSSFEDTWEDSEMYDHYRRP